MHIIAGEFRSRKLLLPPATATRPTSGRARGAIFNIIQSLGKEFIQQALVLDAFAGSGALGLEALSRGAAKATFIESNPGVIKILRQNILNLQVSPRCSVIQADASLPPKASHPVQLVFLDPPYGQGLEMPCLSALHKLGWISPQSLIILETSKEPAPTPEFIITDQRRYGAAVISFIKNAF